MSPPREYVSTVNGVTRKIAEAGSRFDRRLARSKKWALVGAAVALEERVVPGGDGIYVDDDEPDDEPSDVSGLVETGD